MGRWSTQCVQYLIHVTSPSRVSHISEYRRLFTEPGAVSECVRGDMNPVTMGPCDTKEHVAACSPSHHLGSDLVPASVLVVVC